MNSDKLNVLDIFCGCGGLSKGFLDAGFNIIGGIDNNPHAIETFSYNFQDSQTIIEDLSNSGLFKRKDVSSLLEKGINVLIGGPPCQGFSIAGKRLLDDPRNKLYKVYLDFIERISPDIIVMENVPTLVSLYNGKIYNNIISDLKGYDYNVRDFKLNADDYGIPQSRKRVFIIAVKTKNNISIPAPTTLFNKISTKMAISDLPLLDDEPGDNISDYKSKPNSPYQKQMRNGSNKLFNHWRVEHKQKTIDIIKLVPDGKNYKSLPQELHDTRKVNIAWTRMNSEKPCFTIDAGHNHHFHYKANRVPTVRECARIQSFPDNFRFFGNKTSQFRQVGNAVPPILSYELAKEIKNIL